MVHYQSKEDSMKNCMETDVIWVDDSMYEEIEGEETQKNETKSDS